MSLIGFRRQPSPPVFGPVIAGWGGFNKAASECVGNGGRSGNVLPRYAAEVPCCGRAVTSRPAEKLSAAKVRRREPLRT